MKRLVLLLTLALPATALADRGAVVHLLSAYEESPDLMALAGVGAEIPRDLFALVDDGALPPFVRARAAGLLVGADPTEVLPWLSDRLARTDGLPLVVLGRLVDTAVAVGGSGTWTLEVLLPLTDHVDPDVRRRVAEGLGTLLRDRAVGADARRRLATMHEAESEGWLRQKMQVMLSR